MLAGAGLLSVDCRGPASILEPAGAKAAHTLEVWWLMLGLGVLTYAVVMAILVLALVGPSRGRWSLGERGRLWLTIGGGAVVPVVVLLVLNAASLRALVAVAAPPESPALVVDVVGHQWWWEVRYPDQHVSTANEIAIPVGEPVLIHLTSVDVIHSFWVPRLSGKMDLNPGATTTTWIEADAAGDYRGECAEYCGIQHANMTFVVLAREPAEFQAWLSAQQQPAAAPVTAAQATGAQAFATLGCINCHALRYGGTAPTGGGIGPDLTHLASRQRIAAGLLPNDEPTLLRWIANPDALKKGVTMPPTATDAETLRALAAYLSSLR